MSKVAVVTGAAGGMGRAISAALVADGLHVIGLDVDVQGLADTAREVGSGFDSHAVDLTDAQAVQATFAQIGASFGGVDVLVNNAGTCFMSDFPDVPAEEFDRQMAINFSSAFHCCQQAVPLMLQREGVKKIVNISSNGAYNFDVFDPPHYRASKAAMDTLTKALFAYRIDAYATHGAGEALPWRRLPLQHNEMEPSQIAGKVFCGDPPAACNEAFQA